jgi:hypothetical protein
MTAEMTRYKNTDVFIVLFDVSRPETLKKVPEIVAELDEHFPSVTRVLAGITNILGVVCRK